MAAAIALPTLFWKRRAKAMSILIGPVMLVVWLSTSLVLYLVLQLPWVFNTLFNIKTSWMQ